MDEIIRWRFFCFLLLKTPLFLLLKVGGVIMSNIEKVRQLKLQGQTYREISVKIGLPVGTIKSIWSRSNKIEVNFSKCKYCGSEISSQKGKKAKQFCTDKCRMAWWNSHRHLVNIKTIFQFTCNRCGKEFTSNSHKDRKYCSHSCYLEGRYNNDK